MRCSCSPGARRGAGRLRLVLATAGVALVLGGCVTARNSPSYQPSAAVPPAHPQVAVATPPKVTVEADGLPGQSPPRKRPLGEKDDPSEPFSPNYGPPPIDAEQPPAESGPPIHKVRMSEADAARIVETAIIAHEIRQP